MRTLLAILILSASAWGQSTVITASVIDPNGNPYANGSITANIHNPSNLIMLWSGSPLQATTWSANANSSGAFSFTVPDLNFIAPATGVYYTFTVCANNPNGGIPGSGQPSNPCFTYTSLACPTAGCITGNTIDLSTALSAIAPVLPSFGGGSGSVLHCGTAHAFTVYANTAGVTVTCDPNITSDLAGNEAANSITVVNNVTSPLFTSTGTGFLLGPFKTQTAPANPQSTFMTCWGDSTANQFKCVNPDGSNALPTGGSAVTLSTNGVNNTSQAVLNFINPSSFNGLTVAYSNPGGAGNETFTLGGTLNNSGLTNPSVIVNGSTCTLGGTCSVSGSAPIVVAGSSDTLTTAGTFSTQTSVTAGSISFFEIRAHGILTTAATGSPLANMQVNAFGTTGICNHGAANNSLNASLTNDSWDIVCFVHILTTGAPGTATTWGADTASTGNTNGAFVSKAFPQNAVTVPATTTTAQTVSIQLVNTPIAGQSFTMQSLIVRAY